MELSDLSVREPLFEGARCPICSSPFDRDPRSAPAHRITFAEWEAAGFNDLLRARSETEIWTILDWHAQRLSEFIRRGMISSTAMQIGSCRHLAEAMSAHVPDSSKCRELGSEIARSMTRRQAVERALGSPDAGRRVYTILGVAETLVELREAKRAGR